jgi:hypothetical protein
MLPGLLQPNDLATDGRRRKEASMNSVSCRQVGSLAYEQCLVQTGGPYASRETSTGEGPCWHVPPLLTELCILRGSPALSILHFSELLPSPSMHTIVDRFTGAFTHSAARAFDDLTGFNDPSYLTTVHALVDPKLLVLPGGGDLGHQRRWPAPCNCIVGDFTNERYSAHDELLHLLSPYCYV